MVLFGAAGVVAVRGWNVLTGDEAYTRQGVWVWKRDLEAARVDPFEIEWERFDRNVGAKTADLFEAGTKAKKRRVARAARRTPPA